jgi:hypothetical protein
MAAPKYCTVADVQYFHKAFSGGRICKDNKVSQTIANTITEFFIGLLLKLPGKMLYISLNSFVKIINLRHPDRLLCFQARAM